MKGNTNNKIQTTGERGNFKQAGGKVQMLEGLFVMILMLYPLRHIHWGLDLWDTGYNYANFQYMGPDHMDPMWLFSTHLANVMGNFLTKLPLADSLVGMNLYTGLFVSALAALGYWFCTRKLNVPSWIAFVGEFVAISLCWSPTALLYNYLTYIMFLGCVILLYLGLTQEKMWYLFAAGICLGTNVLVRFPNLPEAALIVAVWAYDFIVSREQKRAKKHENNTVATEPEGAWKRGFRHTFWCLGGYLAALAILFGYIQIRYGIDDYIEGIRRLFAMTDKATDYKPQSMIMGIISAYVENLYWVIRIGIFAVGGMILSGISGLFTRHGKAIAAASKLRKALVLGPLVVSVLCTVVAVLLYYKKFGLAIPEAAASIFEPKILLALAGTVVCGMVGGLAHNVEQIAASEKLQAVLENIFRIIAVLLAVVMLVWLYLRDFCSFAFYSYGSMLRPGILFLMLTMFIAVISIFHRDSPKEEKLISGMLILVILLTSIGSNNGVYPSLNNLFVAAPYTFWQCWRFVTKVKTYEWKKLILNPFPIKCVLIAFLAMFLFQSTLFGGEFVFVEATGAQNVTATVENNAVLDGVKMSPERARWMKEISTYVEEQQLQGREVILYGGIPSLSYYLQMPSAFNPWSDLDSYSVSRMEYDLQEVQAEIEQTGAQPPVIIMVRDYYEYLNGGTEALKVAGTGEKRIATIEQDTKWPLIVEFMEKYGYEQTFINDKFVVYLVQPN